MQHEDMLTKLDAAFQSGDAPDIYMERGGGELADHVEAGLTKDISESATDTIEKIGGSVAGWQVDGKTYAPAVLGRRRRLLVQQGALRAGRHHRARPPRWTSFNADVDKLKAAGIEPGLRRRRRQVAGRALLVLLRAARVLAGRARRTPSRPSTSPTRASSRRARTSRRSSRPSRSTRASCPPRPRPGRPAPPACSPPARSPWRCRATGSPASCRASPRTSKGLGENTGWFPFPTVDGGEGDQSGRARWRRRVGRVAGRARRRGRLRQATCCPTRSRRASRSATWVCRPTRRPSQYGQGPGPGRAPQGPRRGAVRPALLRHGVRCSPSVAP